MKTLFFDMEWVQIYGFNRKDFIPTEIGAVISDSEKDIPILESKKLCYDIDIVIRKNIINQVGKTIGLSETVANVGKGEYQKHFNPSYKIRKADKAVGEKLSHKSLYELRQYIHTLFKRYHIAKMVLFGGSEDLKLLRKANVNLSKIKIIDVQHLIRRKIRYLFSLDKVSLIIGFYSSSRFFGSRSFRYPLPKRYKYLIKPHKAIGDACRIFMVYKEFYDVNYEFVQRCRNYLHANKT